MTASADLAQQGMDAATNAADSRVVAAVDRYMRGCERDGACLVRNIKSYGWIHIGPGKTKITAHRAVYLAKVGPIAPGYVVRHTCDRKQCVEPTHLLAGTTAQNARDAYDRERRTTTPGVRGEANLAARLNDALVAELRREFRTGSWSMRGMAAAYGLNYTAVRQAVRGYSWKHVTEPPVPQLRFCSEPSARRMPDDLCAKAKKFADAGLSLQEIGGALGVDRVTAHRMVNRGKALWLEAAS